MSAITDQVLPLIRETRAMLLPHWGNAGVEVRKSQSPADVVTKLDMEVERFLADRLKKIDPGAEFVGEEFGGSRDAERLWLCDPIDGTAHFVRGLPFCTTMLAHIENGAVTFSVIYDFLNDILYHAERGQGAFRNNERITVSTRPQTDAYLSWDTHTDRNGNMEIFLKLREKAVLFKSVASGYEFAMVASGKLEGRVCFDPWGHDWDFAPGALLISEAGGVVANLGKRTYDYRNTDLIAANKEMFKTLTEGPGAIFPIA